MSALVNVFQILRAWGNFEVFQKVLNTAIKRATVRFEGGREKCAMTFVECLGISQEDTVEDPM